VEPAVAVDKQIFWQDTDPYAPNYVTFTIAITNVGPSTIDVLPLLDQYEPYSLTFESAVPYPDDDADDGELEWSDLTQPEPHGFGRNLPPEEAFVVTTVFLITGTGTTTNTAIVRGATDEYGNPADEVQDAVPVRNANPLVELRYFRAVAEDGAVRLEWETAAEVDCVGFRVYRDLDASFGGARAIGYVPARGRGYYYYLDRDVTPGQVYWYWLAEVSTDDGETFHGPVWGGVGPDALPIHLYLPLVQKDWGRGSVRTLR
jgi:hypothetical protein